MKEDKRLKIRLTPETSGQGVLQPGKETSVNSSKEPEEKRKDRDFSQQKGESA